MAREQMHTDEQLEVSLLDRRSYLKLAGTAAATVTASAGGATAASQTFGYGEGQYGLIPYGGSDSGNSAPTIDRFSVSKSEPLGSNRIFSIQWTVSDATGDLDVVEVVVADGTTGVDFSVQDVKGANASGWELFQFPIDTTVDVTINVKDEAGNVTKESRTVSL